MAATIAKATGHGKNSSTQTVHRLGSECASAEAATWRTFAEASVWADGSGYVQVRRGGKLIHEFRFGPENAPPPEPESKGAEEGS